jgi:protein gp37
MGDNTGIEWTDATWQPITGCSVVSPGCTNCYAMRLAGTRLQHHPSRAGLTTMSKAGPVWNGQVRLNEQWLTQPIAWKRPRRIFVCAHGDLFHESIPDEWIDRVFAVVALCPQHTFQVLTKRNKRMRDYCSNHRVLPNVWLGVSCEDQQRVNERIPDLLDTPAAVRWVSAEPLLGPIDFETITTFASRGLFNASTGSSSVASPAMVPGRCTRIGRGRSAINARRQTCHFSSNSGASSNR